MLHAPQDGWYRPCHVAQPRAELERGMDLSSAIADVQPGFYKKGEAFLRFRHPHIFLRDVDSVYWDRWEAVPVPPPLSDPRVRSGAWREVPRLEATLRCIDEPCTGTGVWQAFIARGHALIALVNQQARSQVWLTAGQAFPQPQQDWLLDLPTQDVHWFLMDADGVDISQA